MSKTLTLKNVPDEIYNRLKQSAGIHRRSLHSEALVCLESVLVTRKVSPQRMLGDIQAGRAELAGKVFDHEAIDGFKRDGRA